MKTNIKYGLIDMEVKYAVESYIPYEEGASTLDIAIESVKVGDVEIIDVLSQDVLDSLWKTLYEERKQ